MKLTIDVRIEVDDKGYYYDSNHEARKVEITTDTDDALQAQLVNNQALGAIVGAMARDAFEARKAALAASPAEGGEFKDS